MAVARLFGKDISLRESCLCNGKPVENAIQYYVNLYVRMTNMCDASCKFCPFHTRDNRAFVAEKFEEVLLILKNNIKINLNYISIFFLTFL